MGNLKISTFLMFEGKAEEAMTFYVSLFPNSQVVNIKRYGKDQGGAEGSVFHASFMLNGHAMMCIDSPAKHAFTFTPATSIYVSFDDEAEVDRVYKSLSDGGSALMPLAPYPFSKKFGWVSDRYGVSWQLSLA